MNKNNSTYRYFALFSILVAMPVAAEEPSFDQLLAMPFGALGSVDANVESGSRLLQNVNDLPQSITVLSASDIRFFGYRTLAEILNGFPGRYTSTDYTYTYVGARGMVASGNFNCSFAYLEK